MNRILDGLTSPCTKPRSCSRASAHPTSRATTRAMCRGGWTLAKLSTGFPCTQVMTMNTGPGSSGLVLEGSHRPTSMSFGNGSSPMSKRVCASLKSHSSLLGPEEILTATVCPVARIVARHSCPKSLEWTQRSSSMPGTDNCLASSANLHAYHSTSASAPYRLQGCHRDVPPTGLCADWRRVPRAL